MSNLEIKRIEAELAGVVAARKTMEFKIEEAMDNISRMQKNIAIQQAKEEELTQKLNLIKNGESQGS